MPSPFPGMDPYLEGSEWTSFHAQFAVDIARQLAPKLRPRYVALTMKRFVTETPDDLGITVRSPNVYPDVGVTQVSSGRLPTADTGVVVIEPTLQIATVMPELVPQYSVEIQDVDQRRLVTLIELLSPANKRGEGYNEYVAKRQRVLLSTAHLLEIDLLRNGQRVPMLQPLPTAPYFVFLSRYERRPITEVWQIELKHSLPVVPVPLLPGDRDVALDLQAAFTSVYDSVGYDLILDYTKPPDVPLTGAATKWARQQVASLRRED